MDSETTSTEPTSVATEATDAPAPKRRRASKKAAAETIAASAVESPVVESVADAADAADTPDAAAADAPAAPRKARATATKPRKSAAPRKRAKAAVAPDTVEPHAEVEAVEVPEAVEEPEEPQPGALDTADAPSAPPAFGLLFQAPDPAAAAPRRRATAPVATPAPARDSRADATEGLESAEEPDIDEAESELAEAPGEADLPAGSEPTEAEAAEQAPSRRRRGGRGRRGRAAEPAQTSDDAAAETSDEALEEGAPESSEEGGVDGEGSSSARRRRRRRRSTSGAAEGEDPPGTSTKVRQPRAARDEPTAVKGSTRLEAKKQRRREGREAGRRRTIITEAEFLARRESVDRVMVVRGRDDRTQIAVLEDGVLVEHYVSRQSTSSMAGNVYLGRVQNVLPSMEAAFVDIGKGRNAVLYAGEVNWDAAGLEVNQAKRIENALSSGDTVLVQVTKDPMGHKGARLTSQISLPGRYLVYVPEGSMTGISRKLPDTERARLKAILREAVPDSAGVIVRTAAEGASEAELRADVERLTTAWEQIKTKAAAAAKKKSGSGGAPTLLHGEPDLTVRVIRDVFTEDYSALVVSGDKAWSEVSAYVDGVAPDLAPRVSTWTGTGDIFAEYRVDEQLAKAMDRKVWLPSGGSLVIDRTEAMTVIDVNTGRFVGAGGNLEETVTKNNIEAAEEIVRQLRLRDIGGIIVIDFIDMVLESNRDLVVRRLLECLGRDRTKHQVAEVTSLGLVQMTRKRVGSGLIEVFSESCDHCNGRGIIVHTEPVERSSSGESSGSSTTSSGRTSSPRGQRRGSAPAPAPERVTPPTPSGPTAAQIAATAHAAALRKVEAQVAEAAAAPEGSAVEGSAVEVPAQRAVVESQAAESPAMENASAENASVEHADPQTAADTAYQSAPEDPEPEVTAPTSRPRRRRGRVVAPAGPPRAAEDLSAPQGAQ